MQTDANYDADGGQDGRSKRWYICKSGEYREKQGGKKIKRLEKGKKKALDIKGLVKVVDFHLSFVVLFLQGLLM